MPRHHRNNRNVRHAVILGERVAEKDRRRTRIERKSAKRDSAPKSRRSALAAIDNN
jgi:hypothetical protein